MKYNIFTVLNEGYEKFGILFLSSIIDNLDLDLIENIFVYDTGLSNTTKEKFLCFKKVKIINSGIVTQPEDRLHGDTWQKNVYSKAKLLKHCVESQETFLPTVMVDADSIFVQEFFDLIDLTKDVVLCKRSPRGRSPGHQATSTHIGSFFSINSRNQKSIDFLNYWIQKIDEMPEVDPDSGAYTPKESPALSTAFKDLSGSISAGDLPEPIVANIEMNPPSDARIYHLKSDYKFLTIEARVNQPRAEYYAKRYFL